MLAAYADGVTEGAPADVAEFLATLRPLADDLAFWKQTFEEMPRTEPEGLAFLASRAADSKRARPDDPSHIAGDVLRWVVKPPPTWAFYDAVERLENETTARLAVATLPQMDADRRRTAAGETVDRPVSLAVHTDPALSANIMERIENLRDIPLEAWEIQIQDDPKGTMTSGHAVDFASVVEEVPPGQGPLKPHEVREEFLRADEVNAGTALPAARLRFASWSDLSYEGEKAARDEMYARREQRAKACEYWVAALTAAAGMSPADALASLHARQEEFPAKVPGRDDPMSGNLPMIARVVEQHPDTLAALLAGMRDRLERQRLILTRHLR